jgi:hypothetical protein
MGANKMGEVHSAAIQETPTTPPIQVLPADRSADTSQQLVPVDWTGEAMSAAFHPGPATRPALTNHYRLRGVHYFQHGWPYTFWDNLRLSSLDRDFQLIHNHGFNTIIVFVSWGKFQLKCKPPVYDDAMYAKLEALVRAARQHDLWVVLRVATPEFVPADLPEAASYSIPDAMYDPVHIQAIADLFQETSRRLRNYDNIYMLFSSWEDFSAYLGAFHQDRPARLAFENRHGLFRKYLCERGDLASWNRKWGTTYQTFDEIPMPSLKSPEAQDYIDFITHQICTIVLPRFPGPGSLPVGYECRLDKEPVVVNGATRWCGYPATYRLPAGYSYLCTYHNPFIGAPNDGGFVSPRFVADTLVRVLAEVDSCRPGQGVFIDQLNVADDTPSFTRTNSKLRYPHEEIQALEQCFPIMFERTVGYSLWCFQDYVGNVVRDGCFLTKPSVWKSSAPLTYVTDEHDERRLLLRQGMTLHQDVQTYFNPGSCTNVPYRCDLVGYLAPGGDDAGRHTIGLTVRSSSGKEVHKEIKVQPGPPARYTVILDELGDEQPTALALSAPADNTSPVVIDDVRLFNHLMATGISDLDGCLRRSRSLAYTRCNREWELYERGAAVPAHEEVRTNPLTSARCSGIYPDGWTGKESVVPVHVPFATGKIEVEYYIPETFQVPAGGTLSLRWVDDPNPDPAVTVPLRLGRQTVEVPAALKAPGSCAGDRLLQISLSQTLRVPGDERALGIKLLSVGLPEIPLVETGKPFLGRGLARVPDPKGNRVNVRGHVQGEGRFQVSLYLRGHPTWSKVVDATAPWQASLPLWQELTHGKPELFVEVTQLSGHGAVVFDELQGESERTPNSLYR